MARSRWSIVSAVFCCWRPRIARAAHGANPRGAGGVGVPYDNGAGKLCPRSAGDRDVRCLRADPGPGRIAPASTWRRRSPGTMTGPLPGGTEVKPKQAVSSGDASRGGPAWHPCARSACWHISLIRSDLWISVSIHGYRFKICAIGATSGLSAAGEAVPMARSNLVVDLVKAGVRGDQDAVRVTAEAIAADERAKRHTAVAERIDRALVARRRPNGGGPAGTGNLRVRDGSGGSCGVTRSDRSPTCF